MTSLCSHTESWSLAKNVSAFGQADIAGRKINTAKTEVLSLTGHCTLICLNAQNIEGEQFGNLVSVISAHRSTELDVTRYINNIRSTFVPGLLMSCYPKFKNAEISISK